MKTRENLKIRRRGRYSKTMGSVRTSPFASDLRYKTPAAGGFSPFDTTLGWRKRRRFKRRKRTRDDKIGR